MAQQKPIPAMKPAQARPSRLTVVETVYHHQRGGQPAAVEARYTRRLASDEQPYRRTMTLGAEWQPVDLGWLQGQPVGLLILQSGEKPGGPLVEVGVAVLDAVQPAFVIRPGESFRGEPLPDAEICVRASAAGARLAVTVLPG